ncbi:MAG: hypothetical protein Q4G34_09050 [Micrococcus sp.]|nr:hypothetical protein [Micrococcus sp.]
MRVVLFDAIQETHVVASLERALIAAGHDVYATGRFGSGYTFASPEVVAPTVRAHLDHITGLRPDLILVFRPASAPWPVLQTLRATGAVLATWFSDDPVLFEHSYGPVVELYDVVLHCGDARVLQFYTDRFGRATGVNIPFWTDHAAFPRVYGSRAAQTDVMFLGNTVGPVRSWRYEALSRLRHRVRIYGQVGQDAAGLGGGYLDTESEVLQAAARTRIALNIPQLFADHRDQPTGFPGIERLGSFSLPSRVIQYAAMGVPVVSVVPDGAPSPGFPEIPVLRHVGEVDGWLHEHAADEALRELSDRVSERFDRSFHAAARVMALESLLVDDSWRTLDAHERAEWFLQFDGRTRAAHDATGVGRSGHSAARGPRTMPQDPSSAHDHQGSDVAVVLDGVAPRFSSTDVIVRELRSSGRLAGVIEAGALVAGAQLVDGVDPMRRLDRQAVAAVLPAGVSTVIVCDGVDLEPTTTDHLGEAGVALVRVVTREHVDPAACTHLDLVVRCGPATPSAMALVAGLEKGVLSPGLVESAVIDALDGLDATPDDHPQVPPGLVVEPDEERRDAAAPSAHDTLEAGLLARPGGETENVSVEPLDLRACEVADPDDLARLLRRRLLGIAPAQRDGVQEHPAIIPTLLCAADTVVTLRHRRFREEDLWRAWLTSVGSPEEARDKLAWRIEELEVIDAEPASHEEPANTPIVSTMRDHRARFHAGVQIAQWIAAAAEHRHHRGTAVPAPQRISPTASLLALDTAVPVSELPDTVPAGHGLAVHLTLEHAGLLDQLRVAGGPAGHAAVELTPRSPIHWHVIVIPGPTRRIPPLTVLLRGDPSHPARESARVLTRAAATPVRLHPAASTTPRIVVLPVLDDLPR